MKWLPTKTPTCELRGLPLVVTLSACVSLNLACADESVLRSPAPRETILDRVVRIEPTLVVEIPAVDRWCNGIESLAPRQVDVGDATLYVEEEGEEGVPIVLLHGGPGGTHHYFHPWFSRAAEFARVVYYDQRGCGLSDWTPGADGYSVEQAVADLDALRRDLGYEKWVVLGYSYGGFLGQLYALRHPDRVAGLVLSSALPGLWIDLGQSRQEEFSTDEERARIGDVVDELALLRSESGLTDQDHFQLLVYNILINGDWKRQNFYRPSPEDFVRTARYEAHFEAGFNGAMSANASSFDLTGAFEDSPVPTLILEGEWDLTWGEGKRQALAANHPRARSVLFEMAGHNIYDEQPEQYFEALETFVRDLPEPSQPELATFRRSIADWEERRRESPLYVLRAAEGRSGSAAIADAYDPAWLAQLDDLQELMKLGLALYDEKRYQDGLEAFDRMALEAGPDSRTGLPIALIWQGHLLDLLGRREEAIQRYRGVADMELTGNWAHDQYALSYEFDAYARERMATRFERVEHREPK